MADLEETLLIVDEDREFSHHLKEHFDSQGFYVEVVDSAIDLLAYNIKSVPDLIIGDICPEDIKTLEIRIAGYVPKPPIVILAKVTDSSGILESLRAGAADFLAKEELDLRVLDVAIERQLNAVRMQRENQVIRLKLETTNKEIKAGLEELQEDQTAGRHVQMKMLPERHLMFRGAEFDHCIKPSLYLSGDFFDYFPVSKTKAAFYFADVSGHGASSAFVTVLLKNLTNRLQRNLRRKSSDQILYPSQFLMRVNKEVLDTELGKHLTMFAGIIDFARCKLTYSMGAHFPMPVLTNKGVSQYLEGRGPPVGLFDEPCYSTFEVALEPGFSLILCSDGILEVIHATSLAEKEVALLETIQASEHSIDELQNAFGINWINELPDDIAILLIKDTQTSKATV
jgi:phosphoserine phosphatase RsbU/P